MAITSLDLKFRQSERMTDFVDGGGRMAAAEVVDGAVNNVFSDLATADGIIGNVSLRKIFFQVDTNNTDPFLKPFVFLTDLPQNENVTVLLFDTASATDERAAARSRYENYRTKGTKTQYTLYGAHSSGMRMLQVYCRPETATPDVGDVLCLSIERSGYTPAEQFVKVEKVESRVTVTFTDATGDFQRDVLMIKITAPLVQDFPGQEDPVRIKAIETSPTIVRYTQVSDAARYFGFKACTVAPQTGDTVVKVGTPFVPAVPSTRREDPVVDQLAGLGTRSYIAASAADALAYSGTVSVAAGVSVVRYFGTPYCPGTLSITAAGVALQDNGSGEIVPVNPADTGWSGTADYAIGAFSVARTTGISGSVSASATAAGVVSEQGYSTARQVTAANRALSWALQIPRPSPGSVVLDYRALGKWIRLTDNGKGQLAGNPGEGSAIINYATGAIAATLGALPDVDTALVLAWGTDLRARNSSGEVSVPTPTLRQVLDHDGLDPGTLTMSWTSGGASKTASASGSGAITGDATGAVDVTTGIVEFTTASPPDGGTQITYAYDYVDADKRHTEIFTPTVAGHGVTATLAHAAKANSVVANWSIFAPPQYGGGSWRRDVVARDDGSGGFTGGFTGTNTINYSTGAIALQVDN